LGFSDNPSHRNLSVHVVSSEEKLDLYTIDQRGMIGFIPDFTHNSAPRTVTNQRSAGETSATRFGRNTRITAIPSAWSDTADLISGNTAGGLIYLKDKSPATDGPDQEEFQLSVYPNPSAGPVTVIASASGTISLINTLGQVIVQDRVIAAGRPIPIQVQPLSN